jgi:hypothetical protein
VLKLSPVQRRSASSSTHELADRSIRPISRAGGFNDRSSPVRDLLKDSNPGLRTPMCPYVAPHTAKIHTLITLGIRHCAKTLVFQLRKHRPCGFDSHRPLQSQATPGHAGLQDWRQHIDPMGKSWEIDAEGGATVSWSQVSPLCSESHTYSHTQQCTRINCVIPTLHLSRAIAGGSTRHLGRSRSSAIWLCIGSNTGVAALAAETSDAVLLDEGITPM